MIPVVERFNVTGSYVHAVDSDRKVLVHVDDGGKRIVETNAGGRRQSIALMPDTYRALFDLMCADLLENVTTVIDFGD